MVSKRNQKEHRGSARHSAGPPTTHTHTLSAKVKQGNVICGYTSKNVFSPWIRRTCLRTKWTNLQAFVGLRRPTKRGADRPRSRGRSCGRDWSLAISLAHRGCPSREMDPVHFTEKDGLPLRWGISIGNRGCPKEFVLSRVGKARFLDAGRCSFPCGDPSKILTKHNSPESVE